MPKIHKSFIHQPTQILALLGRWAPALDPRDSVDWQQAAHAGEKQRSKLRRCQRDRQTLSSTTDAPRFPP